MLIDWRVKVYKTRDHAKEKDDKWINYIETKTDNCEQQIEPLS